MLLGHMPTKQLSGAAWATVTPWCAPHSPGLISLTALLSYQNESLGTIKMIARDRPDVSEADTSTLGGHFAILLPQTSVVPRQRTISWSGPGFVVERDMALEGCSALIIVTTWMARLRFGVVQGGRSAESVTA